MNSFHVFQCVSQRRRGRGLRKGVDRIDHRDVVDDVLRCRVPVLFIYQYVSPFFHRLLPISQLQPPDKRVYAQRFPGRS